MNQLVLSDAQAQVVSQALHPVEVRDQKGNILAIIQPTWTEEDLAEAERVLASDEPGYTYEQVKARLALLEKA